MLHRPGIAVRRQRVVLETALRVLVLGGGAAGRLAKHLSPSAAGSRVLGVSAEGFVIFFVLVVHVIVPVFLVGSVVVVFVDDVLNGGFVDGFQDLLGCRRWWGWGDSVVLVLDHGVKVLIGVA
uniref:(northern house mosquito) hypothetical protein n=1 Tax=Culex pipiens TaxID=7175 RepID=A0A8D8BQK0_CULPI